MKGWIGFDFDGTLSRMAGGPVVPIVNILKAYLAQGIECKIVTARIHPQYGAEHVAGHTKFIQDWLENFGLPRLEVTPSKDYDMVLLYDDRAVAVETDTGRTRGWLESLAFEA